LGSVPFKAGDDAKVIAGQLLRAEKAENLSLLYDAIQ
jgi:hypothetical protein